MRLLRAVLEKEGFLAFGCCPRNDIWIVTVRLTVTARRNDEAVLFDYHSLISSHKSFHSGFMVLIKLSFFFRFPPLICFSRFMASSME
ncbi:hypothetical protein Aconfl_08030 [Algoriphagus confluentis]|uniref:Uncharacterized protein n=1 Tax=Algoriphagus confluentis TaxID=1697556 RepID=A0ABQ6PJM1_9BACT|nr:hypothetical protein Aconfl_08030 [Algoriphagus confluentis]